MTTLPKQSIRAVVVGLGVHGRSIVRTGTAAGLEFVAAIDPFQSGADLADLAGSTDQAGTAVVASIDDVDWPASGADIAIVTAKAPVADIVGIIKDLLARGVDVITLVEDAYDLRLIDPSLHEDLDRAARQAGRTVVATGTQDIAWVGLVLSATGLVRGLESIEIKQHLGVDGYPEEFVRWVGIGCTEREWQDAADVASRTPSVLGGVLPTLARGLGLTPGREERTMEIFAVEHDLESTTFGRIIPAGDPAGRRDTVTLKTAEGIDLVAELITSAVMGQDDFSAAIQGETRVELAHRLLPGPPTVDATLINRIPDVLAAPPGLLATPDLPGARYRHALAAERAVSTV